MSRPQSKKELEEAGRRKLEAFRKQRAAGKTRTSQTGSLTATEAPAPAGSGPALFRQPSASTATLPPLSAGWQTPAVMEPYRSRTPPPPPKAQPRPPPALAKDAPSQVRAAGGSEAEDSEARGAALWGEASLGDWNKHVPPLPPMPTRLSPLSSSNTGSVDLQRPAAPRDESVKGNGPLPPPPWLASLQDGTSSSGPRSTSGRDFVRLQGVIEDLTQQKFELSRGLEGQRHVAETLAAENEQLVANYNRQGGQVQDLREEVQTLRAEVKAQQAAMQTMLAEQEASRSAVAEASDSSQRLAREVVALEEKVLQAHSQQLKAEKASEAAAAETRKATTARDRARTECASTNATLSALQEEKAALNAKLRQAILKDGTARAQLPPRHAGTQTDPPPEPEASTSAAAAPPPKTPRAHGRPLPNESIIAHPSQAATSARIASDVLAQHAAAASPESHAATPTTRQHLPEAVRHLLPVTLWAGGVGGAAALVMADERACLESIHSLMDGMERDQRSLLSQLQAQKAHSAGLQADNAKLVQKLQLATQRFELAVARASFAGQRESAGYPSRSRGPTSDHLPAASQPAPTSPFGNAPPSAGPEKQRSTLGWLFGRGPRSAQS
ncbi:hypothetical protein WJX73_009154 [Symbiochloris irregularis]|uniref:Uncharacterized protein n=1 Tax=Symbiochloris irregularis TaxID=706552 RepID=A0AAW1NTX9_9CHLO